MLHNGAESLEEYDVRGSVLSLRTSNRAIPCS
jgi:hypothetical protein